MEKLLGPWADRLLSVLRIMSALLLLAHGSMKLLRFPGPNEYPAPEPLTLVWFAGVLELVGGGVLALGLCTRIVAFVLSGEMAFAYFIVHAPRDFYPILNGGELAVLFCFVFLYLAARGGGAWSLDRVLFAKKA